MNTQAGDRIVIDGPVVTVRGEAVTSLALVLHETATNAAKYGSLSTPEGGVRVSWNVSAADVVLHWEECGGPAVAAPPDKHGFGSTLVRRSVTDKLQGTIDYDWRREGLAVHVTVPLESLERSPGANDRAPGPGSDVGSAA